MQKLIAGFGIDNYVNNFKKKKKFQISNISDIQKILNSVEYSKFINELPNLFASYEIIDADIVRFNIIPTSAYSRIALNLLSRNVPIVPWHDVWREINATYAYPDTGSLTTYENDWLNYLYPDEYKVCSGPYVPVYRDAQLATSCYQYRDDWWGAGILYRKMQITNSSP